MREKYNLNSAYHSEENREVAGQVLPFLLCPSTKTTKRTGYTTGDKNNNQLWDSGDDLAYTDYGGIYGIEGPPYQAPWGSEHFVADHAIGVMVHEIPTPVRMISDGLSQTAMIGECTGRGGGATEQSEWSNGQNIFAKCVLKSGVVNKMLGDFANMTDIMSYQDYQTIADSIADAVAKSLVKATTKGPLAKLFDNCLYLS